MWRRVGLALLSLNQSHREICKIWRNTTAKTKPKKEKENIQQSYMSGCQLISLDLIARISDEISSLHSSLPDRSTIIQSRSLSMKSSSPGPPPKKKPKMITIC
uniref:Uncharacterized protein n=1 Tax=Opuntia streptacantha TaxID=393608 RepID=A0A7C8ZG27_OPUST